ncbi:NAD(P)-binding protein [Peniophora sp. CONT]|nr:NAD(P)-binding protein [Peniophora sp. CONT]
MDEVGIFSSVYDVYPLIDPAPHFASQTFADKVVIITGQSVGLGATAALFYAKAGAKVLIFARFLEQVEKCKKDIEKEVPGAQVMAFADDITDPEVCKRAVKVAVEAWGRVDIVLANQTVNRPQAGRFADQDPVVWWHTQEVNVRGTLNIVHAAIPELLKTKGSIIASTSAVAHAHSPISMDFNISKHTLNRFVEILALDYPELYICAVGLDEIETSGSTRLSAPVILWLTARNAEFLSGRYVQATWDINEVMARKDDIVRDNLLVTKLAGPTKESGRREAV